MSKFPCPRLLGRHFTRCVVAVWIGTTPLAIEAQQQLQVETRADDPLSQPISLTANPAGDQRRGAAKSEADYKLAISTLVGGLATCLGAFLLFVWATRRAGGQAQASLPEEVIEHLGRMPLANRQSLQLIRLGRKLVLLCVTPQGATTLSEIADVDEATRLAGLCLQSRPRSVTSSFRDVLGEFAREPHERRFTEPRSTFARGSTPRQTS